MAFSAQNSISPSDSSSCFPPVGGTHLETDNGLNFNGVDAAALDFIINQKIRHLEGSQFEQSSGEDDENVLTADENLNVQGLVPLLEGVNFPLPNIDGSILDKIGINAIPPQKRKVGDDEPACCKKPRPNTVTATVVERITPTKPPKSNKDYRIIILSNGLKAVLIKDNPNGDGDSKLHREMYDTLQDYFGQKFLEKEKGLPLNFPAFLPMNPKKLTQGLEKYWPNSKEFEFNPSSNILYKKQTPLDTTQESGSMPMATPGKSMKINLCAVVNVGISEDPEDCDGLAHFTEHMVHYGSKRYPGEAEYMNFNMNYGTNMNAFTQTHTTTYFSSVAGACVEKGLDMMSRMLSEPIFSRDMTCREVNAVDSEFNLKQHIDLLRRWFLFQTVLKKGHPLSKFGFGNKDTLLETKDIHQTLRNFHTNHYVASAMTLGVQSELSLDEQECLVLKYFSDLPEGNRKTLVETPATAGEKNVKGKCFNQYFAMQGLCTFSSLWVVWPISISNSKESKHKSLAFVEHLLSDESEGSLSHFLKKENYIWFMLVRSPIEAMLMDNKYTTLFTIDFFLTPKGQTKVLTILQALYSYIDLLEKIPQARMKKAFDELKLSQQRIFDYGIVFELDMFNSAMAGATSLQHRQPKDILKSESWDWQSAEFCCGAVKDVLAQLAQTNMNVIQTLPSAVKLRNVAKNDEICVAPYTQAEYVVKCNFPNFLENKKGFSFKVLGGSEEFMGPVTKVPRHFGSSDLSPTDIELPNVSYMKVIKAIRFGNPPEIYQGACFLNFLSPNVASNARNFALTLLWTTAVGLRSLTHPKVRKSSLAGVMGAVVPHFMGISIGVIGFPERLFDVLETLTDQLLTEEVSERDFNFAQNALIFLYDLLLANEPEQLTNDFLHFMTCKHSSDVLSDALVYIKSCSLQDVNNFRWWFKKQTVGLVIMGGNLPNNANNIVANIINKQDYFPYFSIFAWLFKSNPCSPHMSDIPLGEKCIRVKSDLCTTFTNTVKNFYFVGKFEKEAYLLWRSSLYFFSSQAFQHLRTRKQLGYVVRAYHPGNDPEGQMMLGVGVTATASRYSTCQLDKAIDEFMVAYGQYLDTIQDGEFNCIKTFRGHANDVVTLKQARDWYKCHFGINFASDDPTKYYSLRMSKLSIQFVGKGAKNDCKCDICQDISEWKRGDIWNHLQFAQGQHSRENYFVSDPRFIRDGN